MSGETILIEQLRADVSQLRDDRADLQERCNRLSAEKAEALRMLADAEDLANEANAIQTTDALRAAESEIDALRRQLASRTEAIQTSLATTRELRDRAEKAERERDDARDALQTERRLRDLDVAKALAERDEAIAERDAHNAAATQYEADIASLRAERDARPDISAEDAAALVADYERVTDPVTAAEVRALAALRAHAAKVKP